MRALGWQWASPLLAVWTLAVGAQESAPNRTLEEAKEHYRDGRFGQALVTLKSAIVELEPFEGPTALLEEAHLYTGLAYIALDETDAALASFTALLQLAPERKLDPQIHAPKVVELFERARRGVENAPPRAAAVPPPPDEARSNEDRSKTWWALLGAGAGVAGGALATGSDDATPSPDSVVTTTTTVPPLIEVDYRVNNAKLGSFACSRGILFTVDITKRGTTILLVEGLEIEMMSRSPECLTHRVRLDGRADVEILPSTTARVRSIDLSGDLCRDPGRRPGCDWMSDVIVSTNEGVFRAQLLFSTTP